MQSDDTCTWVKKIKSDILSKDARVVQWAKELSEHLRNSTDLWKLDSTVRHKQSSYDDYLFSIIEKVRNWQTSSITEDDSGIEVS